MRVYDYIWKRVLICQKGSLVGEERVFTAFKIVARSIFFVLNEKTFVSIDIYTLIKSAFPSKANEINAQENKHRKRMSWGYVRVARSLLFCNLGCSHSRTFPPRVSWAYNTVSILEQGAKVSKPWIFWNWVNLIECFFETCETWLRSEIRRLFTRF